MSASSASGAKRLLPLIAVAALVAGLLLGRDDPGRGAAALAPPDTALWVRADDAADIVGRFPSLRALQERWLGPERDVRPWLGSELAVALPAGGGDPLVIAEVADRDAAERFQARLARPSAFVGDFLAVGPGAVRDGPSLADTRSYRRAAELDDAPLELYAPAAGVRRLLDAAPAVVKAIGGFADAPHFEGLAARVRPDEGGLRVTARVLRAPGAPPPREFAPTLRGRAPASAAAFLDAPGAAALVAMLERGGAAATVNAARAAVASLAGVDLDRDLLGPLAAEAAVTLTARGATPVFTLTARSGNPALTREVLARLQEPLADALGAGAPGFRALDGSGYSLAATPQLEPSYTVDGNVLIASTAAAGLAQRTLARRGLAQELALRAVSEQAGGRIEALAFADLRQLLALGERTGLTPGPGFPAVRDDLGQVRAAGAVVRREKSDSTVELFLEIP